MEEWDHDIMWGDVSWLLENEENIKPLKAEN